MQYKEEARTYLEREIRKVVDKESDLLKKVHKKLKFWLIFLLKLK